MYYNKYLDAAAFKGKTFIAIKNNNNEELIFTTNTGEIYKMYHSQDCCESVTVYDIKGDLNSILNIPLVTAGEYSGSDWPEDVEKPKYLDSYTWTTYKFRTETNIVIIRWLGESNGYYSESVQIAQIK